MAQSEHNWHHHGGHARETLYDQHLTIGVTTTLLALCIILFAVRITARKLTKFGLWWDDWWMLGVTVRT